MSRNPTFLIVVICVYSLNNVEVTERYKTHCYRILTLVVVAMDNNHTPLGKTDRSEGFLHWARVNDLLVNAS